MFGLLWSDGSITDIQHSHVERAGAETVEVLSLPDGRGPMTYDRATKAASLKAPGAPSSRATSTASHGRTLEDAKLLMIARGQSAPQWAKDMVENAVRALNA